MIRQLGGQARSLNVVCDQAPLPSKCLDVFHTVSCDAQLWAWALFSLS